MVPPPPEPATVLPPPSAPAQFTEQATWGDPLAGEVDENAGKRNNNPPGISFRQLLKEDLRTHEGDWLMQGFWAIAVHRFGNWRMDVRPKLLRAPLSLLYKVAYKFVEWTCGISMPYTVQVGRRVHLWHHGGMIIGALAIGDDVHIRQNITMGVARRGASWWQKPVIEDRCDIGAGAVIVGPISVGHDSAVGANAVVIKNVPPHSVAVGVPAKVIKTLAPGESAS